MYMLVEIMLVSIPKRDFIGFRPYLASLPCIDRLFAVSIPKRDFIGFRLMDWRTSGIDLEVSIPKRDFIGFRPVSPLRPSSTCCNVSIPKRDFIGFRLVTSIV